jgi:hypothetical protein
MTTPVLKFLWNYRGFIQAKLKINFRSRYTSSILEVGWELIQSLTMILVYTVIFYQFIRVKLLGVDGACPDSIYFCEMSIWPSSFSIAAALASDDTHLSHYEWRDLTLVSCVINRSESYFAGITWMPLDLEILH